MTITEDTLASLEFTRNEFWNISKETGNFIEFLIKVSNAQNVIELGTSNGYSGLRIALALKITGGKLTTIEYWEKRRCLAVENFKKCGVDDIITSIQGSALPVIREKLQNETFDFVFLDANKAGYIDFFKALHPLLKVGGIIVADDIVSHSEAVKPFLDEILNRDDYYAQILNTPDDILIARKNK